MDMSLVCLRNRKKAIVFESLYRKSLVGGKCETS